jgi:hypothetical protein
MNARNLHAGVVPQNPHRHSQPAPISSRFASARGRSVVVAQEPSKLLGRVRFPSPALDDEPRGVAQSGSAPGWGPGGRRFKSCLPDRNCGGPEGPPQSSGARLPGGFRGIRRQLDDDPSKRTGLAPSGPDHTRTTHAGIGPLHTRRGGVRTRSYGPLHGAPCRYAVAGACSCRSVPAREDQPTPVTVVRRSRYCHGADLAVRLARPATPPPSKPAVDMCVAVADDGRPATSRACGAAVGVAIPAGVLRMVGWRQGVKDSVAWFPAKLLA